MSEGIDDVNMPYEIAFLANKAFDDAVARNNAIDTLQAMRTTGTDSKEQAQLKRIQAAEFVLRQAISTCDLKYIEPHSMLPRGFENKNIWVFEPWGDSREHIAPQILATNNLLDWVTYRISPTPCSPQASMDHRHYALPVAKHSQGHNKISMKFKR